MTDSKKKTEEMVIENSESLSKAVPFDAEELLERLGGNASALEEIVVLFLESMPRSLKGLYEQATNGDWTAFRNSIHDLKGTTVNVAAKRLHWLLAENHTAAGGGIVSNPEACRQFLQTLQQEYDLFRKEVEEILHPSQSRISGEILVVDDEEDLRDFLSEVLRDQGFTVRTAASGQEARRQCEEHLPDVVISDIRMRQGTGRELLEWLGQLGKAMPIVICMSAFTDLSTAQAFELGAHAVFSKPFEVIDIVSAVQRFLNLRNGANSNEVNPTSSPTTLGHLARTLALGELTAALATELASPLETVITRADTSLSLLNQNKVDPNLKKTLESIVRTSQRTMHVLQSLGTLSQYSGSEEVEPFSIPKLVQEAVDLVARRVVMSGIQLDLQGCNHEEKVLCRPSQTILALATILRSCLDSFADQKNGQISIEVQPETFMINLTVSDNGGNIAERGNLLALQNPLAPRDRRTAGLNLARILAEDERGSLVFDTKQGLTRFTLRLPRAS